MEVKVILSNFHWSNFFKAKTPSQIWFFTIVRSSTGTGTFICHRNYKNSFPLIFDINGCEVHCHLVVNSISSEYLFYKICPQIASWTCLIHWLFLTLCKCAALVNYLKCFSSLEASTVQKKISGAIPSQSSCLLCWLPKVLPAQRKQVDRHGNAKQSSHLLCSNSSPEFAMEKVKEGVSMGC